MNMNRVVLSFFLVMSGAIAPACQPSNTTASNPEPTPSNQPAKPSFDEALYLFVNPDVAKLIQQGKYKSGLDHYTQVGQTAKKPDGEGYESFFTGTEGNDTVQGFGKGDNAHFSGVAIEIVSKAKDSLPLRPKSLGKGEKDILVGTQEGDNEFLLGSFITAVNPKAEAFYVGEGDADYAQIQNFTPAKDAVILSGQPKQYKFELMGGNVRISTAEGDLVAIIEGITTLKVDEIVKEVGMFTMKVGRNEKN
jgi:hypothetical protein